MGGVIFSIVLMGCVATTNVRGDSESPILCGDRLDGDAILAVVMGRLPQQVRLDDMFHEGLQKHLL